jgi:predicted amidohydrolase
MRARSFPLLVAISIIATSITLAGDDPTAKTKTVATKTLRVAAAQMRSTRDLAGNLRKISEILEKCAKDGVRVVVFPECAVTGYFDKTYMQSFTTAQLADAERQICETCRKHNIYTIIGMPWRDQDKLFNSAVVISSSGAVLERYHKLQLAESWPIGGDHLSVFPIDGVPCSIIVCHDVRYPELVRLPVLAGSRVVFFVSHESGIDKETKIAPYRAQIQARAVENSVFVVQANAPANKDTTGSHGQSRIIAPDGNILHEALMFSEEVVTATINSSEATGKMASMSVSRGTLGDWWKEGISRVRIIGSAPSTTSPTETKAAP